MNSLADPQLTVLLRWVIIVLAGLAFWFIKREFSRISDACERIPPKEWFDEIDKALRYALGADDVKKLQDNYLTVASHEIRVRTLEAAQLVQDAQITSVEEQVYSLNIRFAEAGMGRRRTDKDKPDGG